MTRQSLLPLPFNFRRHAQLGRYLLTNDLGARAYVDESAHLDALCSADPQLLPAEKVDELTAKNFLSPESEVPVRTELLASHLATRYSLATQGPGLFIVVPSLRCDHDCKYCQVSRVPRDKVGFDLSSDHIDRILQIIAKSPVQQVKVEFQGGEPLLAFDFIRTFVDRSKYCTDKSFVFTICSALGPLTQEVLTWARSESVTFSVSLDGSQSAHLFNRPSKYFNSHSNTIDKVRMIQDTLGADRVACLSTVTRPQLNDPSGLVDAYNDLGLESIFIRPVSSYGFATKILKQLGYTAKEFFEFYRECLQSVVKVNQQRLFVEETAAIHLRKLFRPSDTSYVDLQSPAGYVFGAIVFNYDGRIFGSDEARMLWRTTKAEELVLGHLSDPEMPYSAPSAAQLLADTFLETLPGCSDCAYRPYCGADPLHHLTTQGDHIGDKSISFFCQLEQLIFDYLLELWESNPYIRHTFRTWLAR